MYLFKIARYAEPALGYRLHMNETISYNDLVEWYGATKSHMSKMRAAGFTTSIQESKVPSLNVPDFVGNPLKGDLFEQKVVTIFGNNVMALFLTSEYRCDNHSAWSGAFASRLRDSLRNYTIVEYLSTELEEE